MERWCPPVLGTPGCLILAAGLLASSSSRTASEVRYGLDGQVRNEGQRTMPGVRDLPADPLPARLSERRSMPGRSTSALSKVETDSALERPRTKDVRRVTSPFAARVPVNAAGGAYGNWARPGSSGDRASRGRSANVPLMGLPLAPMTVSWPADTKLCVRGTTATRKRHSAHSDAHLWRSVAGRCRCGSAPVGPYGVCIGQA